MGVDSLSVMSLAGSGFQAGGAHEEGKAMKYGEDRNAAISQSEIANVEANSAYEISKVRRDTGTLLSRQGALYAKAGVRFSGSALKVMAETAANAEMDVVMMQHNKNVEVSRLQSDIEYRKMLGKNYVRSGNAKAVNSITGGVSKFLIATSKTTPKSTTIQGGKGGTTSTYQGRTVWSPAADQY